MLVTEDITLKNLTDGWHNVIIYTNDTLGNMGASDLIWFYVSSPDINVWPSEINKTLYQGDITSENITISNYGCSKLEFNTTSGMSGASSKSQSQGGQGYGIGALGATNFKVSEKK